MTTDTVRQYLADCRAARLSDDTIRAYEYAFTLFERFSSDAELIQVATADDMRAFFVWLQGRVSAKNHKPPSAHTQHQVHRSLTSYFNWLARQGLRADNPLALLRKPRLPKRVVPRLSDEQLTDLLEAASRSGAPARDVALMLVLIDCGLRVGELVALDIEDVDLRCQRLLVQSGKGNKQRRVPFGQKTATAVRELTDDCAGGALFRNVDGERLGISGAQRIVKHLGERAQIAGLHPHLLRHTFARKWLERGNVRVLQEILGHAKLSTTEIYTQLNEDDLSAAQVVAGVADHLR